MIGVVRTVLLASVLVAGAVTSAHAQAGEQPATREQLERRLRQAFFNRIRQELRLSPNEVRSLEEVIRWSETERQTIAATTRELNRDVTQFLRSGGTEADARDLLERRAALQTREAELFQSEQARLLEVMSAPQVVRFYEIRDQLNARIRRLRTQAQGRPPGTDGG